MINNAQLRPAAAGAEIVPALTAPEAPDTPNRRERSRWRQIRRGLSALVTPRQPLPEIQHAVLERLLALLEAARADLSAGWVQDCWWAAETEGGQRILMTGLAAGASGPRDADPACLVGALIRAGAAQGAVAEPGRAIDAVYEALWESRGEPTAPGMLSVSSPQVRQARIQALTRWNDARGRTGEEILAILDRAIARVIQSLAVLPTPLPAPAAARPLSRASGGRGAALHLLDDEHARGPLAAAVALLDDGLVDVPRRRRAGERRNPPPSPPQRCRCREARR